MADFLTREGIVQHLESIIAEAKREVVLISPYIKLDKHIQKLLGGQKPYVDIHVVYRENKLKPNESRFLERHRIKTTFLKDLHAKCYLNENEVLLTSMNLYEHSLKNNVEMGLVVSKSGDEKLYNKIRRQVSRWIDASENTGDVKRLRAVSTSTKTKSRRKATVKIPTTGFCIRCRNKRDANTMTPYCPDCWVPSIRSRKTQIPESYCHFCSKKHRTTLSRPLCPDCFKKYGKYCDFVIPQRTVGRA